MKSPIYSIVAARLPSFGAATCHRLVVRSARFAGVLLGAGSMFGQTAPATPSPAAGRSTVKAPDETVVLTPFQVVADERGYQSFNTLSGTRLNSKLEDLGSSITVVTKQQLIDTAAIDINDVFLYEANTEGTGNFTQFNTNRTGGVQDNVSADPQTANRIRGIGGTGASGTGSNTNSTFGANTAIGNFASNAKVPLDLYNIDSVEINRGPTRASSASATAPAP
jgi:hypothetical protein